MADVTLRMLLVGKDVSASKSIRGVGDTANNTGGKLGKLGRGAKIAGAAVGGALLAAGAAAVQFGSDALKAGSDAQQSLGGVEAVFGKQAKGIETAATDAANALGLSKNEYRNLATTLGAGLKNKGIKDYAAQTQNLIGVGADLAAQFGGSTTDAVDALASAMRGESDPIEKYGVSLNESAIKAELAARGQSKLKGAALEQAKAQARLAIIMRQTADAQGAFGRESDTLANKQQRADAKFKNFQATIGTALLPAFEKLTDAGMGLLDWLDQNPKVMAGASAAWDLFTMALGGLWDIVRKLVLPGIALLNEYGIRPLIKGLQMMFDALGNVPGFEWAKGAAEKLKEVDTAIGEVDEALNSLAKDPPAVTVETEAAKKNVADVQTKIDGIKGKIVTAKAKGDDKELKKLKRDLEKAEKRKYQLSVRARAISGGGWKITGNVSGSGDRYTLKAFRMGGRPRPGQIAQFHKDEFWVPDAAGTVISQSRSRALMGTGPAALNIPSGGGDVNVTLIVDKALGPVRTSARQGRETAKNLAAGQRSLRGRTYQFKAQTA